MELHELVLGFLLWGVYPLWLIAGAVDYICHRRTDIALTSGAKESRLHVAQFLCLAGAFALAIFLEISLAVWIVMLLLVIAHSALAFTDVSYTLGRRRILAVEQLVHGYMEVLPWVALVLLGILHLASSREGAQPFALKASISAEHFLLFASFLVLAGAPIAEEWVRTVRAARFSTTRMANGATCARAPDNLND